MMKLTTGNVVPLRNNANNNKNSSPLPNDKLQQQGEIATVLQPHNLFVVLRWSRLLKRRTVVCSVPKVILFVVMYMSIFSLLSLISKINATTDMIPVTRKNVIRMKGIASSKRWFLYSATRQEKHHHRQQQRLQHKEEPEKTQTRKKKQLLSVRGGAGGGTITTSSSSTKNPVKRKKKTSMDDIGPIGTDNGKRKSLNSSSSKKKDSSILSKSYGSKKDDSSPTTTKKKSQKSKMIISKKETKINSRKKILKVNNHNDEMSTGKEKKVLTNALKDTVDVADALGDAIRNRADEIIQRTKATTTATPSGSSYSNNLNKKNAADDDHKTNNSNFLYHPSIESIGWAMGSSDRTYRNRRHKLLYGGTIAADDDDDGDVEDSDDNDNDSYIDGEVGASPSSVVANYFLRSHGGAHAIQCLCSLLSVTAGLISLLLLSFLGGSNNSNSIDIMLTLQKRCLLFAMIKHISGLISSCIMAARAIPMIGFRKSRSWIESIVKDPVSQYVFYCACIMVWLPKQHIARSNVESLESASKSYQMLSFQVPTWQRYSWINVCFVGPVLIREIISTMFVLSDVLVLLTTTGTTSAIKGTLSSEQEINGTLLMLLKVTRGISDAIMSLLVTPQKWNSLNASSRQIVLATVASKCTLLLELVVGFIMTIDSVWSIVSMLFGSANTRSNFEQQQSTVGSIMKRLVCTRLYIEFLWMRKKKISNLVLTIRGGASQFPFHALEILLHPLEQMGITNTEEATSGTTSVKIRDGRQHVVSSNSAIHGTSPNDSYRGKSKDDEQVQWTWFDYVRIALVIE